MREIKFRAWDRLAGKYKSVGSVHISGDGRPFVLTSNDNGDSSILCIQNVELELYTGYTDIHYNDIYEGDIIKNCAGGINKVIWHDGAFIICGLTEDSNSIGPYYILLSECSVALFEVIGNIHENPELING
jgi:uncharacterized phage protein (TIGR01671 family)